MSKNGQGILFVGDTGYIRASPPQLFLENGARHMIPIHWGTFILSHEPIEEPLERRKGEVNRLGIEDRVCILQHGESFIVPEKILFSRQDAKGAKKKEFARIGLF